MLYWKFKNQVSCFKRIIMPISERKPCSFFFTADKKDGICYSVMVQACLFLTLIGLCFFSSSRHFCSCLLFSFPINSKSEKLEYLKLDLNESTLGELAQVPGIGKSIASEIVNYRKTFGEFSSLDEIEKIKGVGKKTAEKIRPHLVVTRSTLIDNFSAPRIWIPPNIGAGKTVLSGKINHEFGKIDPNLATIEELKKLPGIGDVLAKRIVDKRQDTVFHNENDLQKVSGVGKKTALKIAPFLIFPLINQ